MDEKAAPAPTTRLVLATVDDYPDSAIAELDVLVSWLNANLAEEGLQLEIRIAGSVPEVARGLAAAEIDFYLDSPHPVLLARSLGPCRPILRRWKFGTPTYRSVIFTLEGHGATDLEGLRGRRVALEDRFSSSSFFLPVTYLFEQGLEGPFLPDAETEAPQDRPGYVFSGGDTNSMFWVLAGKVSAAAMNEWNFEQLSGDERDRLHILATTDEIPRHLLAVREDLPRDLEEKVRRLLLQAHESPEGQRMLEQFSSTAQFDPIPDEFLQKMGAIQDSVVHLHEIVNQSSLPAAGSPGTP